MINMNDDLLKELMETQAALAEQRIHKLELIVSLINAALDTVGRMEVNEAMEFLALFNEELEICIHSAATQGDAIWKWEFRDRLRGISENADLVRKYLWLEIEN